MLEIQKTTVMIEAKKATENATYLVNYRVEGNNLQSVSATVQITQMVEQPSAEGVSEMVEIPAEIGTIEMYAGQLRIMSFPYSADVAKYIADFVAIVEEITAPAEVK